jgi:hypothetical protein
MEGGRVSQPHPYRKPRVHAVSSRVKCDNCGKKGAAKAYRLNPRNYAQHFRTLCGSCRGGLRYTLCNYDRPHASAVLGLHGGRQGDR